MNLTLMLVLLHWLIFFPSSTWLSLLLPIHIWILMHRVILRCLYLNILVVFLVRRTSFIRLNLLPHKHRHTYTRSYSLYYVMGLCIVKAWIFIADLKRLLTHSKLTFFTIFYSASNIFIFTSCCSCDVNIKMCCEHTCRKW